MNGSDKGIASKVAEAEMAATAVKNLIEQLSDMGVSRDAIFAGLHGAVVAQMAIALGGRAAADACMEAALQVLRVPAPASSALANAVPMGRA